MHANSSLRDGFLKLTESNRFDADGNRDESDRRFHDFEDRTDQTCPWLSRESVLFRTLLHKSGSEKGFFRSMRKRILLGSFSVSSRIKRLLESIREIDELPVSRTNIAAVPV